MYTVYIYQWEYHLGKDLIFNKEMRPVFNGIVGNRRIERGKEFWSFEEGKIFFFQYFLFH